MVKKFKDFDMDKHAVDTLNKLDDLPEIVGSIYQTPPVKRAEVKPKKPYNSFDELVKQNKKEEEVKQKR